MCFLKNVISADEHLELWSASKMLVTIHQPHPAALQPPECIPACPQEFKITGPWIMETDGVLMQTRK